MSHSFTLALAQINPIVGDLHGNLEKILAVQKSQSEADLIIFPELSVTGYPPEDLLLLEGFLDQVEQTVLSLAQATASSQELRKPALLIGAPWRLKGGCYNCAILLDNGAISALQAKVHLPNYSVFDEKRYFKAGELPSLLPFRGIKLGVMICEDMWFSDFGDHLAAQKPDLLIVLNASPFDQTKVAHRLKKALYHTEKMKISLLYVNQIGGQDELVFDGGSFILNEKGAVIHSLTSWVEEVAVTSWHCDKNHWFMTASPLVSLEKKSQSLVLEGDEALEALYQAMMLGLRDYVGKNHFSSVLLGLSGGIDSALTAAVAVDALGASQVTTVMMASPFTLPMSLEDAREIADLLSVCLDHFSIEPAMAIFDQSFEKKFSSLPKDSTEENIQARVRGLMLMALSNKSGALLLTTGNKSEISVGYTTLYGDMCGGFSVLKDLYKTKVFELSSWRNRAFPKGALGPSSKVMPERVITKAPSAELRPNQTDQDSLPPYPLLDKILEELIENRKIPLEISPDLADLSLLYRVERLVRLAEHKRRQSPPGVKVTPLSFGRDWRFPLTHGFIGPSL